MNYAVRYRKFWLRYLMLTAAMITANTVYSALTRSGSIGLPDLLFTVLTVAGLWPLLGYVRQVAYSPRWLWLAILAVDGLALLALTLTLLAGAMQSSSPALVLLAVAAVLLGGPNIFALHQYLFRSPHLWS